MAHRSTVRIVKTDQSREVASFKDLSFTLRKAPGGKGQELFVSNGTKSVIVGAVHMATGLKLESVVNKPLDLCFKDRFLYQGDQIVGSLKPTVRLSKYSPKFLCADCLVTSSAKKFCKTCYKPKPRPPMPKCTTCGADTPRGPLCKPCYVATRGPHPVEDEHGNVLSGRCGETWTVRGKEVQCRSVGDYYRYRGGKKSVGTCLDCYKIYNRSY